MSVGPDEPQEGFEPLSTPSTERTTIPGIFLIVVGVLNIVLAGIGGFVGFSASKMPTEELRAQMQKQQPKNLEEMEKAGWKMQDIQNMYLYGGGGGGCLAAVLAIPIILGGIVMCMRKAYGLAVTGAILSAIPCLSPSACPCLFGMAIGIWALIVLLNADVKAAFH
jgi:hypothetical protein